jgi:L-gulonolactone oxidase
MSSVGSISEQTLGGVIATATHGSGLHFGVISTSVISLTLLLADGTRQMCSRDEHTDLFLASLCGLGATGLILTVTLAVEPSFRLEELQKSLNFEEVVTRLDEHVSKAQHVRLWWYPPKDVIRVSYCNRTDEVSFSLFDESLRFYHCSSSQTRLANGSGILSLGITSFNFFSLSPDTIDLSITKWPSSRVG